jgi:hypothetical protein
VLSGFRLPVRWLWERPPLMEAVRLFDNG